MGLGEGVPALGEETVQGDRQGVVQGIGVGPEGIGLGDGIGRTHVYPTAQGVLALVIDVSTAELCRSRYSRS